MKGAAITMGVLLVAAVAYSAWAAARDEDGSSTDSVGADPDAAGHPAAAPNVNTHANDLAQSAKINVSKMRTEQLQKAFKAKGLLG